MWLLTADGDPNLASHTIIFHGTVAKAMATISWGESEQSILQQSIASWGCFPTKEANTVH